MLAIERKNEILDKLRAEQRVLVSDLAAYYHVTEETIRRDLDKLEKEGYATKTYVPQALREVPHLIAAWGENGTPVAFMGIAGEKLEMLFLAPEERGRGLGRALVQYGMEHYGIREVTINEQNLQARGFYARMGFRAYERLDHDEQGKPYPILKMRL